MRSLEERLAEINRRSQALEKKKKQRRKQTLLCCIPLLLCVVTLIWLNFGKSPAPVSAEVNESSHYTFLSDCVKVEQITNQDFAGSSYLAPAEPSKGESYPEMKIEQEVAEDSDLEETYGALLDQPITGRKYMAYMENGTVVCYTLEGNVLTNTQTGETVELTENELETFLQLVDERSPEP